MTKRTSYPCVENVQARAGRRLLVTFRNGTKKVYDCSPLLEDEAFKPLANEAMFKAGRVDQGGYGISWNDEIDLSESELWIHGLPADR